jgi:hypothetical protein
MQKMIWEIEQKTKIKIKIYEQVLRLYAVTKEGVYTLFLAL